MKQKSQSKRILIVTAVLVVAGAVRANNIAVTNTVLGQFGTFGSTYVECDVSWDNSWRASWLEGSTAVTNWDAAWIFVKYRVATNNAPWQHATLSTNNSDHIVSSQALFNVGTSSNAVSAKLGVGGFLYRKNEASGNWTNHIKLCWNFAKDGVSSKAQVVVSVHAIEMVYVPQGSFYVGDGTAANVQGQFCSNTAHTTPFQIMGEGAITLGGNGGSNLGNNNKVGMGTVDDFDDTTSQTLLGTFPKGYNAFYCMKYEITEGQWVSFFNMLTDSQKTTRDITSNVNGGKNSDGIVYSNTVYWATGDATSAAPDRACNYLCWADGVAYADWAGLRPMTELEFEKACRGPLTPVANEYAWGTTVITDITGFSGTYGSGAETALPANANCNYNNSGIFGPVRCGIYATSTSGREASGATYWGIMEMSGNLWERTVTVGNTTGRAFTGAVGDGKLNDTGDANADYWPGTSATGAGFRGGNWYYGAIDLRSSARYDAANVGSIRRSYYGFRAVRPVPTGGQ